MKQLSCAGSQQSDLACILPQLNQTQDVLTSYSQPVFADNASSIASLMFQRCLIVPKEKSPTSGAQ